MDGYGRLVWNIAPLKPLLSRHVHYYSVFWGRIPCPRLSDQPKSWKEQQSCWLFERMHSNPWASSFLHPGSKSGLPQPQINALNIVTFKRIRELLLSTLRHGESKRRPKGGLAHWKLRQLRSQVDLTRSTRAWNNVRIPSANQIWRKSAYQQGVSTAIDRGFSS